MITMNIVNPVSTTKSEGGVDLRSAPVVRILFLLLHMSADPAWSGILAKMAGCLWEIVLPESPNIGNMTKFIMS